MDINVNFDFTLDTPGYWDNFWDNNHGYGGGGKKDPDYHSKTLQLYHQYLWSKPLPCGEEMKLECKGGKNYYWLEWNGMNFSSDSIIVSFRHAKNKQMIEKVQNTVPDYKSYVENYVHKGYTIGGMIIFPMHSQSLNQRRGINPKIQDRWDLTLECIRRYYLGLDSPLSSVLEKDRRFFDLFVNFKGYVDYFYLQDCVSRDYSKVDIWLGNGDFSENPLPQTVEEYFQWIDREMEFLNKRSTRILFEWLLRENPIRHEDDGEYEKTIIDPELPPGYKKLYKYYTREGKSSTRDNAFFCHVFVFNEIGVCVNDYRTWIVHHKG